MAGAYQGTVKSFDQTKQYGWITPDNYPKDVFVSWSEINDGGLRYLNPGDRVTFDIEEMQKGPQARNVFRI